MLRIWGVLAVLVLSACAGTGGPGEMAAMSPQAVDPGTEAMNIRVRTALNWISENSTYPAAKPPRFLSLMTAKQIGDYATNRGLKGDVLAMFDCASGTMFLNAEADYERNLLNRSIIVHELVHHLQCVNHRLGSRCTAETEAYAIQAAYINQSTPDAAQRAKISAWAEKTSASICASY